MKRYNVNRMGEQFINQSEHWMASVVSVREMEQIKKLEVGRTVSFERGVTGAAGAVKPFVVTRIQ